MFCENSWIPTLLTKREICTRPEMACLTPSKSAIYDYTQHREQGKLRISSQKFWSGRVMWKVITGMFHLTNQLITLKNFDHPANPENVVTRFESGSLILRVGYSGGSLILKIDSFLRQAFFLYFKPFFSREGVSIQEPSNLKVLN